jgi:hypothetical protein
MDLKLDFDKVNATFKLYIDALVITKKYGTTRGEVISYLVNRAFTEPIVLRSILKDIVDSISNPEVLRKVIMYICEIPKEERERKPLPEKVEQKSKEG